MRFKGLLSIIIMAVICPSTFAQKAPDQRRGSERILCILPMVGAGTYEDPRRPMYAPTGQLHLPTVSVVDGGQPGGDDSLPLNKGILGFTYVVSDDGQFALAEFVASDRAVFKRILADANVKGFIVGNTPRSSIETEFRKYKANINIDSLEVGVK